MIDAPPLCLILADAQLVFPAESTVTIMQTKCEITLKKAVGFAWPDL